MSAGKNAKAIGLVNIDKPMAIPQRKVVLRELFLSFSIKKIVRLMKKTVHTVGVSLVE
jgi:hypothetical protein